MIFDPITWALALSGAGLLIAGGAVLRGGSSAGDAAAPRVGELEAEAERWRVLAERAGFDAQRETEQALERASDAERELATACDLLEAARQDLAAERESQQGLQRELAAERALAASVEATATELRTKLREAEEAAKAASPPAVQINKTNTVPPPPDAALRREVDQLKSQLASVSGDRDAEKQRALALLGERDAAVLALSTERARAAAAGPSVAAVTAERDAAREKVEALERLVDGVRARSRELTAELRELKAKLPPA
ncbi:MAG: hypothetical protein IT374_10250 [Polyangiaceae bacterium]|nr:hypothetical protein [Polyangiaceae bacterium]